MKQLPSDTAVILNTTSNFMWNETNNLSNETFIKIIYSLMSIFVI